MARILFLLTQSLDYPSGLGRYGPLARQLTRLGHTVEVAALHPAWDRLPQRQFDSGGVRVAYVGQMHVRQEGDRRLYFSPARMVWVSLRASLALARAALSRPADIVHVAKAQPMNGLAGWWGARLRGRRWYLDCDDYEAASNNFGAGWQRAVVRLWEDALARRARGVTVNTTFLRDRCRGLGVPAERLRLVPNGFDPERFRPAPPGQAWAARQKWGLEANPAVLYLGSLSLANHPLPLLLDAFEQVWSRLKSARLLLVGGGEDYDRVMALARERACGPAVIITGRVDPALAPALYTACDVVVDPVLDDDVARARSPLKIVEGMACGAPVVTGDVGDRADMLAGGRAGVLVRPGDAGALAAGLLEILENPVRRKELAAGAAEAGQRFRWDRLARDFAEIYNE